MILLALALFIDPLTVIYGGYTIAPDLNNPSRYGTAVSISGTTALIGAPNRTVSGSTGRGEVFVYLWTGTTWSPQGSLLASDGGSSDQFGAAVSINGDTAIIGAPGDSNPGFGQGSAYVFTRVGTTWTQAAKLVDGDGIGGSFGSSVSIGNSYALVGAPTRPSGGAVVYYEQLGAFWFQAQSFAPSDLASSDQFGSCLSAVGDEVVIGSALDDDHGSASGSAYVFTRSGGLWTQSAKLTSPMDAAGDNLGRSVSLNGDRIAVGAPGYNTTAPTVVDAGAVVVFERPTGTWQEVARIVVSTPTANQKNGQSVVATADGVIIGGDSQYPVFAYASVDGVWCPEGSFANGTSGTDVPGETTLAYDAGRLMLGLPRDTQVSVQNGMAQSFKLVRTSAFTPFCYGDGTGTPCPCSNNGDPAHGCGSSVNAGGAQLLASGNDMVFHDTVVLALSGTGYFAPGLYFQGTQQQNGGMGVPLGDGLACVGGTAIRLAVKPANAGMSQFPDLQAGDPPLSIRGQIPAIGGTRYYQVWYRNNAVFCAPETFNLSSAVSVVWVP